MGRDCRFRIVEASRDTEGNATLSEKDAQKLIDEVKEAAIKKVREGVDFDDAVVDELASRQIEARRQAQIQERRALSNLRIQKQFLNRADEYIAEGLNIRKSIQAILVGVQGLYNQGRASVDSHIKTITNQYMAKFNQDLDKSGYRKILTSGKFDLEIEKELFSLSRTGKSGVSGSKEAQAVADIFHRYSESLRQRLNRAGADISTLDNFSISQTHDRVKIRKLGYEAWRNKIINQLDHEKTFGSADKEEFLRSAYEVITTGISKKKTEKTDNLFAFKGARNLAKKVSNHRVLHFKDAETSHAYRMEYGTKSLSDGLGNHLITNARNVGLLEKLGTNPQAMVDALIDKLNKQYRDRPDKIAKQNDVSAVQNFYKELDLSVYIPENPTLAKVGSTIRMIQSMSSLGGAVFSSITDLPVKAIELQGLGKGVFESYGTSVADVVKAVGGNNETRMNIARSIRAGSEAMSGAMTAKFSSTDDLPGMLSKAQRLFFKMNFMTWWNDAQKDGTAIALANHIAGLKNTAFDQLDADISRHFNNAGITQQDWDIIRQAATKVEDGEYITPDAIQGLDDAIFGKNALKQKEVLEDKLRGFYLDIIDHATITPDAREQAISNQGTLRGTPTGELLRFMMQFKSFPITLMSKMYGRAIFAKGRPDYLMMVQSSLAMTALGYAAMSAKDIVKGKEPRPLNDPKTFLASYLQGGGGGILGDFVFGEFDRFGRNATTAMMGPTAGDLNDLFAIFTKAKSLEGADTAASSVKFIADNTPFANLFYVRPVLNYTMLYQLQESLNPGSLRRMEKRVKKENDQEFFIKPSSVVK